MSNDSTHIKLHTGSFIEIQRLQLDLNDAEIPYLIKNNNESARMAGYGSFNENVQLFVFSEDLEKANQILENFKDEIK